MSARRAVRDAKGDPVALAEVHRRVGDAKVGLGECSPSGGLTGSRTQTGTSSIIRITPAKRSEKAPTLL
jgi:hypothetical protein